VYKLGETVRLDEEMPYIFDITFVAESMQISEQFYGILYNHAICFISFLFYYIYKGKGNPVTGPEEPIV
jgi:hypothetical protein